MRTLGALGAVVVILFLLSHVVRSKGRILERRLFAEWGGTPTTAWLRHRDTRLDPVTKGRYHGVLEAKIGSLHFPSEIDEQRDPAGADHLYASAVKWLLEFARDIKAYRMVFEENMSYGFRRNTLAGKPLALTALVIVGVATIIKGYVVWKTTQDGIGDDLLTAWVLWIAALTTWITLVTKAWVKDAADAYARALLSTCDERVAKQ